MAPVYVIGRNTECVTTKRRVDRLAFSRESAPVQSSADSRSRRLGSERLQSARVLRCTSAGPHVLDTWGGCGDWLPSVVVAWSVALEVSLHEFGERVRPLILPPINTAHLCSVFWRAAKLRCERVDQ